MSAIVDGQPWASDVIAITADTEDRFVINALSQAGEQLILVIRPVMGTQMFEMPATYAQLNRSGAFWSTSVAGGGSAVVDTAIAGRVTGRFEFYGSSRQSVQPSTRTVLEGRFAATFTR